MTSWINLDSSMWPQIGLTLAHFVWQGALIALAAAGALFLLRRRSPQSRYFVCGVALGMMAAAPPITFWSVRQLHFDGARSIVQPIAHAPTTNVPLALSHPVVADAPEVHGFAPPGGDAAIREFNPQPELMVAGDSDGVEVAKQPPLAPVFPSFRAPTSAVGPTQPVTSDLAINRALGWSAILWLCGVVLFASRLSIGWAQLRRLTRIAHAGDPAADLTERFERMARKLQCRDTPRLQISRIVTTPVTFGLIKPIVMIPVAMLAEVSPQWIECILAHELAHIRRRDVWINLLQRVIESLLFFHPAVWWLSDRMRLERELCCDDIAVGVTGCPADYAEALVTTARRARGARVFAVRDVLASGITGGKMPIRARVRRILSGDRGWHGGRMRSWLAGPIVLMAAGSLLLVSRIEAADKSDAPESAKVAAQEGGDSEPGQAAAEAFPQTSVIETDFRAAESWQDRVNKETEAVRQFLPIIEAYQSFHDAIYSGDGEALKRVFAPDGRAATDQDIRALRTDIDAMGFGNAESIFDSPWDVDGIRWVEESSRALLIGNRFSRQSHGADWYYQFYCTMQKSTRDTWLVQHLAILPTGSHTAFDSRQGSRFELDKNLLPQDIEEHFLFDTLEAIGQRHATEPAVYRQLYLTRWKPRRVYTSQVWRRPQPTATRSGRIELVDQRDIDDQSFTLLGPVKNVALVASGVDKSVNIDGSVAALDAIDSAPQVELIKYPVHTQASGIIVEVSPVLREALLSPSASVEVKKGQLLLRLVDDELKLDLAEAQVRLDVARSRHNRMQALAADQQVSQHELEETRAQMRLAELQVERQALALSRTRVTAPADGMFSSSRGRLRDLDMGKQVEPGLWIGTVTAPAESSEKTE